ncbi:unnamed protein product, partial [Arabidopsis halleri]
FETKPVLNKQKLDVRRRKETVVDLSSSSEMVKHRNSSRSIISYSPSIARLFSIKAISLYLIFVFAFTIWVLVFSSRNIQTDDDHTKHQQQHRDLIDSESFPPPYLPPRKNLQNENTQLWTPPSIGLHSCVKPTPKYKEFSESDHYITVRCNGGLNQMRTGVIHVAKSDSRLANNDLPIDIQRLRCRVLYRGLRFSPVIESLGQVWTFLLFILTALVCKSPTHDMDKL